MMVKYMVLDSGLSLSSVFVILEIIIINLISFIFNMRLIIVVSCCLLGITSESLLKVFSTLPGTVYVK